MEKLLNFENDWDGDVDCPEVMGSCCLILEEEVAAAIKLLKMGKAAGRTCVVSEMMKATGGFGSRWVTDLINNIVKEGCIPDDWRNIILVPVYKGKGDPLVCGSYRAIKLLEQPMKVLDRVLERGSDVRCQLITCSLASCLEREPLMYKGKGDPLVCGSYRAIKLLEQPMKVLDRVLERGSDVRCQLITCSLASCLEREPLMPFSSCDRYKRNIKQRRRSCTMLLWI